MATPLLDWIIDLMRNGDAREAFNSDPQAAMASAGFTNVCGGDIRPFLMDEPSIREVGGVDLPHQVAGDSNPQEIKYIVNNYTIEAPDSDDVPDDGPEDDGPDGPEVNGDGNTVTDEHNDSSTDNSDDNSTGDSESEAKNIVPGDGSAGEDQIQDSTFTDIGQGITGDGNSSFITLVDVVDTGDVHALSDLVNLNGVLDQSLNDSPILQNVLDDSVNDMNNLVTHLLA
ncbi:MAG TPA: IniB N-terminal domain-containing protein [Sporichthya sp.]|nr:IniB N-terminal domain-containing protein [Sporichthya sp.]